MDFGIVEDMTMPGAFDEVVKSLPPFTAIIHQASPFMLRNTTNNTEILDPAINGTTELLRAVKNHAPEVKRVVYTSSCAAVIDFNAPVATNPRKVYMEEDWNPVKYSEALKGDIGTAYRASKKFAELAALDFVRKETPNFDLVTLNPPMVYGPYTHPSSVATINDLGESNFRLWKAHFTSTKEADLPPNGMHMYIDVRDLAIAHRLAITNPEAGGERIIVSARAISSQDIADIWRRGFPALRDRVPIGKPGTSSLDENAYYVENAKARKILGLEFRSDEESFGDLGRQLLEIEGRS